MNEIVVELRTRMRPRWRWWAWCHLLRFRRLWPVLYGYVIPGLRIEISIDGGPWQPGVRFDVGEFHR